MQLKASALILAATLAQSAFALNTHRHAKHHRHAKKDVVYLETDYETLTQWTTLTVWEGGEPTASFFAPGAHQEAIVTSSSSSSSSTTFATSTLSTSSSSSTTTPTPTPTPTPSSTYVAPVPSTTSTTTQLTTVQPTTTVAVAPSPVTTTTSQDLFGQVADAVSSVVAVVSQAVTPQTTSAAPATGGNKRGVAYNDASLTLPLLGSGSKISWGYNWDQTKDGLSDDVEFVPMLWGPSHASTWAANIKSAIAGGAKNALSFNEPDNTGQANLSPQDAATQHITYFKDLAGSIRIGAPAITNSGAANEGVNWLKQWVTACNGNCPFDFCPTHWYSPADPQDFLNHALAVQDACQGKPVWVTEFAPLVDDDATINTFLIDVQDQLDNNATFSFVERYSYFMVSEGRLLSSSSSLTEYGQTFAFA